MDPFRDRRFSAAIAAMQGILASFPAGLDYLRGVVMGELAEAAFRCADALIAEERKGPVVEEGHVTAALRSLGEWLARREKRTYLEFSPEKSSTGRLSGLWTIKLVERGTDVAIADADEWFKAVNMALEKAGP
jgi:hypothetical protein